MKYMLLIYGAETEISDQEREKCYDESKNLVYDLAASGHFVAAAPLQTIQSARSVRVRDGRSLVTDGPFAETHEQLGGYFLVEARDEGEALSIASRIPAARWGTVEVRPLVELAGMPE